MAAGLLLGAAMRPQLVSDDRPAGPQMLAGWSGVRSTGPFDDGLAFASYSGEIPSYVLGTDWEKLAAPPAALPELAAAASDAPSEYDLGGHEPPPVPEARPALYEVETAEAVSFPSLDGGAAYDDVSRAENTPLAPLPAPLRQADIDAEAPPEATGDTTVAR